MESGDVFIHPTADVSDDAVVGSGTRIWHQAQVREGARIGGNCILGKNVYIDFRVEIGSNVKVQNNANIYHGVTIEDDVFIGPGVTLTNDMYPRALIWSEERVRKTIVKRGASVGANSTVVCGVVVGENALVYGNPAKLRGFVCKCGCRLVEEKIEEPVLMKCPECETEVKIPRKIYDMKE
jgi:UDP-2-acetamido-3-amino-2,3-dideoxy-glucuronate N-acetyltransferase